MNLLAIETATAVCGAALLRDGAEPVERILDGPNVHSERLVPMIEEILESAALTAGTLDVIAVSIGPGSFTGLRIGLSVAKGLCFAAGTPLVAVPTLEALAWNVIGTGTLAAGSDVLALLDAHRGEMYCAGYRSVGGHALKETRRTAIESCAGIAQWLAGNPGTAIVGDAQKVVDTDQGLLRRWYRGESRCSPVSVGLVGRRRFEAGEKSDPAELEPLYMRDFIPRSPAGPQKTVGNVNKG